MTATIFGIDILTKLAIIGKIFTTMIKCVRPKYLESKSTFRLTQAFVCIDGITYLSFVHLKLA